MASLFSERQQGNLPNTSKVNPRRDRKEHFKAITLRSGKIVETDIHGHEDKEKSVEDNDKEAETSVHNEKNNAETMANTGSSLRSLVENTPMKVK